MSRKPAKIVHKIGDEHFVDNIMCKTFFVNNGIAWIAPMCDGDEDEVQLIRRHLAYAKIYPDGKIVKI